MKQSVTAHRSVILSPLAAPILLLAMMTGNAASPDYSGFDELLMQNVHNGFVDYDGITDNPALGKFVRQVGEIDARTLSKRDDQLTFYINAYNALAIRGILDGYSPVTLFGRYTFFKSRKYIVMGEEINLLDLERKVLIPMGEPRIHFAIVCASTSCPHLSSRAYLPETLEQQLEQGAQQFINDISQNRFDLHERKAYVSKIFDWYEEEFEEEAGSLQRYLARYVEDTEVAKALGNDEFDVRFLKYDWNLNGRYSSKPD